MLRIFCSGEGKKRIIPFSTPQQAQNWIEKYVIILRRLWEHGAKVVNCGNLINSLQSLLRLTYQQHHWGCSSTQSIYSNCTVLKDSNSSTRYLRLQQQTEYIFELQRFQRFKFKHNIFEGAAGTRVFGLHCCQTIKSQTIQFNTARVRVAEVVRRHEGPSQKSLDSDEIFKP